jgi:hypothetical protein
MICLLPLFVCRLLSLPHVKQQIMSVNRTWFVRIFHNEISLLCMINSQQMTKQIPLTKGKFALVDDEDYESLNRYKWCITKVYASRGVSIKNKNHIILMHRVIVNAPPNMQVDHINGDPLDNRKCNLRICTHAQNIHNQKPRKCGNRTSGFKGVSRDRRNGKWRARIHVADQEYWLGVFENERDAAAAYNEAARRYHGEFAYPNQI